MVYCHCQRETMENDKTRDLIPSIGGHTSTTSQVTGPLSDRGLSVWPLGARDPGPGARYRDPSHEFDSSGDRGGVQVQPQPCTGCLAQLYLYGSVQPQAAMEGEGRDESRPATSQNQSRGTVAFW